MTKNQKFFICEHCKNLIGMIDDKLVPVVCCGEQMKELTPNTVDAAQEKHLPDVKCEDGIIEICVGSVLHPMEEAHYISFIYLQTEKGGQRKALKIGETPCAKFSIIDDKAIAVYAYCNLHGLWMVEL